ncbi:MAG TPA: M1 family metallopeptidase [Candidatus Saccharimonadales bacterium]|nr:M1 family metallopeptidase [Candidatus Saccharimonadales bacterium]
MSKKVKQLFQYFQPSQYDVTFEPDRETMHLTTEVMVTGKKTGRPSQRITLHQHDLTVTQASITRKDKKGDQEIPVVRINYQRTLDEVRLHTDAMLYPGEYVITLKATSKITDAMHGVYPCYYEHEGKKQSIIATQFESHHAREAFPCIDEPAAKAVFNMSVISPKGETVLGNTPVAQQKPYGKKQITTFEPTPKMSTYLLAFAYGDLQSRETTTKDGVAVRVWATKVHKPEALDFGLDAAKRSIEFFDEYFGVPYPLAKADHIALPDFSAGAMENWGLVTYREACLLADPDTASQSTREVVCMVIAHETSHQWFGNLVTMRWWNNLWLNESFANVMEYVATDALYPDWHIWNTFITQEGLSALRRDSIAGVQPVQTDVNHPDEISTLFDPSIVYAKGGRLLRMLMQYVGEGAFRKGLKDYFTKHAYANTTGDDLWAALSAASGKDIAAFMNPWLLQSGFPVVDVTQKGTDLSLSQTHFLLDPQKADGERVWPVPLLSQSAGVPELLEGKTATGQLASDEFVRINQGATGHYIVHYTEAAHQAAIAGLVKARNLGDAERLMLLSDSSLLSRGGQQSFDGTLRLLENYTAEDAEPVWDIMALILGDARRFIDADAALEEPIKRLMRGLIQAQYDRLGWQEKSGEPVADTKLRATITGLGVYAEHPAITEEAIKLFAAYQKDPQAVPAELRSIVFDAAVRHSLEGAFAYLLKLEHETTNADLKLDLAAALTSTRKPEEVKQLLARLKDADQVRPQDIARWLVYLMRNRHVRTLAWDWMRANWEWLEQTFGGDKSYDSFPRYAASCFSTRELLKEYRAFFEPKQSDLALARNITMGIEELENRVAWLEHDLAAVQAYFARKPQQ